MLPTSLSEVADMIFICSASHILAAYSGCQKYIVRVRLLLERPDPLKKNVFCGCPLTRTCAAFVPGDGLSV